MRRKCKTCLWIRKFRKVAFEFFQKFDVEFDSVEGIVVGVFQGGAE